MRVKTCMEESKMSNLPRFFTDEEWMKRFDNHEIVMREQGKQILDGASYVFKLENSVKDLVKIIKDQEARIRALEIYNKQNMEVIVKLCDKIGD